MCCLFVVCGLLVVGRCLLFVSLLCVMCCSLFVVCGLVFVLCYALLFVVCRSLFVVCCLLLGVA